MRPHVGDAGPGRQHVEMFADEALAKGLGRVGNGLDLFLVDGLVDDVELHLGSLGRHAGLEAAHDRHPAAATIVEIVPGRRHLRLHHHRHDDVAVRADLDAIEPGRRYADDRHRMAIDDNGAIENRGVATETPLPEAVAEHGDGMRSRRTVVSIVEYAPQGRTHAKDIKVVAADDVAVDALGAALPRDSHSRGKPREKPGEDFVTVAKILVHRIGEGHPVERAALKGARPVEKNQLRGVAHRQPPQQHLVHQRENGSVGPHPESERQDDDQAEAEVLAQAAEGVFGGHEAEDRRQELGVRS